MTVSTPARHVRVPDVLPPRLHHAVGKIQQPPSTSVWDGRTLSHGAQWVCWDRWRRRAECVRRLTCRGSFSGGLSKDGVLCESEMQGDLGAPPTSCTV